MSSAVTIVRMNAERATDANSITLNGGTNYSLSTYNNANLRIVPDRTRIAALKAEPTPDVPGGAYLGYELATTAKVRLWQVLRHSKAKRPS
jgi:hypothetical protein